MVTNTEIQNNTKEYFKKYSFIALLVLGLLFTTYKLIFSKSDSVKLLEKQVEQIKKEKDSLIRLETLYLETVFNLKSKSKSDSLKSLDLRKKLYLTIQNINNKIKEDEKALSNVDNISLIDANYFLSNYKYTTIKSKEGDY